MAAVLFLLAFVLGSLATFGAPPATSHVSGVAWACLVAIGARMLQASEHQKAVLQALKPPTP